MSASLINSPLRRWDVIAQIMGAAGYRSMVEVGCKEGRTTGFILKNVPESSVIAIDPWRPMPGRTGDGAETYEDWDFAKIEAQFKENTAGAGDRLGMLRMTSLEALEHVPDLSVDLVFVDAGHDYENALADIAAWWQKVRRGGCMSGHDYQHKFPGVMRAVAECFPLQMVGVGPDSVWYALKDPQ